MFGFALLKQPKICHFVQEVISYCDNVVKALFGTYFINSFSFMAMDTTIDILQKFVEASVRLLRFMRMVTTTFRKTLACYNLLWEAKEKPKIIQMGDFVAVLSDVSNEKYLEEARNNQ